MKLRTRGCASKSALLLEATRRRAGSFHRRRREVAGEQGRYAVGHGASLGG